MLFQKTWTVLLLILTVMACKNEEATNKIKVQGTVKNLEAVMAEYPGMFTSDSLKISLFEVPFGGDGQPIHLDSAYVSKANPKFELEAQATKQALFDVMIDNGPMMPVVNDAGEITLEVDMMNKENYYTTSNSPASKMLHDFIFGYSARSIPAGNSFKTLDSLKVTNSDDSSIIAATENKNRSMAALNDFIKETLRKADNPIVAAFVLGMGSRSFSPGEYDSLLTSVIAKHPRDPSLQYLKNQLLGAQSEPEAQGESWVGKPAPELTMADVNGKEVSLSSFKGKYVLVDFWASWCGPCRMENPNVVKAYKTFKDKNFTVLGVSLDKDREPWLEAIKKDDLDWTHISDLAFWNSKSVEIFKFQGIPYNVLVNPEGIIVAESLRGEGLMAKLKEEIK